MHLSNAYQVLLKAMMAQISSYPRFTYRQSRGISGSNYEAELMLFIKRIFTWWNGSTFGTNWQIRRKGAKVGSDVYGNTYFEQKSDAYDGRLRRWVTYTGYADASRIPPEWQGWLNYTHDAIPTEDTRPDHAWELEHRPNLTGTLHAYKPKGSLDRGGKRAKVAADYEAWSPDA